MNRGKTLILVLLLSGCVGGPPPGEGEKAERGYEQAQPIIVALEQWHTKNGIYPQSLEVLVPAYFNTLPVPNKNYGYTYRQSNKSYELRFNYTGPGMNICSYSPLKRWECIGYF
jgi:hypothetical protein